MEEIEIRNKIARATRRGGAQKRTNTPKHLQIVDESETEQERKEYVLVQYFLTGSIAKTLNMCRGKFNCTQKELTEYIQNATNDELAMYRRKAYEKIVDKQVSIVNLVQDLEYKKLSKLLYNGNIDAVNLDEVAKAFRTNYQVLEFMKVFTAKQETITVNNVNIDVDSVKKLEDME